MRTCMILLVIVPSAFGTAWHVPGDFATIQEGLDGLNSGDTLVVAPGIYSEALHAPAISFVWLGVLDSGGTPDRPVVDPSLLEHPDSLSCLILPAGSQAVIEEVIFRNGPEMFPHQPGSESPGGLLGLGSVLTLRHCRFDSTNYGLIVPVGVSGSLEIGECTFAANVLGCVENRGVNHSWIHQSEFSGSGNMLLWVPDSALVENCTFHGSESGSDLLWVTGSAITVRNCVFDSTTSRNYDVLYAAVTNGCLFEGNLFHDLYLRGEAMTMYGWPGGTSVFQDNVFRNCIGVGNIIASGGLNLQGQENGMSISVTECVFDSCTTWTENGFGALYISLGDGIVEHSRFVGHEESVPAVQLFDSPGIAISDCHFDRTGLALLADYTGGDSVIAENDWWGDSTGPYHAVLNPGGLGDTIVGPVDFVPWLTDTNLTATEPHAALPQEIRLSVHPNPFNETAMIRLAVREAGTYEVNLYNTLGQKVKGLWAGFASGEREIVLSGAGLASGEYFVRAQGPHVSELLKIVLLK